MHYSYEKKTFHLSHYPCQSKTSIKIVTMIHTPDDPVVHALFTIVDQGIVSARGTM